MFKARGTRIIFENDAPTASAGPLVLTTAHGFKTGDTVPINGIPHVVVHVPDHAPEPVETPIPAPEYAIGNFGTSPAMLALPEVIAKNAEDAADLAAVMGMGFPALPPNFRDQLLAAQAGNIDAIVLMRRLGEQVPQHLQMAFMEMVHDMLTDADSH